MTGRAITMRTAKAEAEEYFDLALQMLEGSPYERMTAEQAARARLLATSYVQLGGLAIERFMETAELAIQYREAARGA